MKNDHMDKQQTNHHGLLVTTAEIIKEPAVVFGRDHVSIYGYLLIGGWFHGPDPAMWGRYEMCVRRRFVIVISYPHTCLFGFRILASSPGDGVVGRLRMLDHMTGLWSSQLLALQLRDCNLCFSTEFDHGKTAIHRNIVDCTVQQYISHG